MKTFKIRLTSSTYFVIVTIEALNQAAAFAFVSDVMGNNKWKVNLEE